MCFQCEKLPDTVHSLCNCEDVSAAWEHPGGWPLSLVICRSLQMTVFCALRLWGVSVADTETWCGNNHLFLHVAKTKEMVVDFRRTRPKFTTISTLKKGVGEVTQWQSLGQSRLLEVVQVLYGVEQDVTNLIPLGTVQQQQHPTVFGSWLFAGDFARAFGIGCGEKDAAPTIFSHISSVICWSNSRPRLLRGFLHTAPLWLLVERMLQEVIAANSYHSVQWISFVSEVGSTFFFGKKLMIIVLESFFPFVASE